jgi:pyruvate dehydrogenase E1 component alpha subunit
VKGGPQIAVTGFGEAAADEGLFWEAISFAALHKLPVVFVCENNRYSTYSALRKRQPADNISERVATFTARTWTLFGNDVVAVYQALAEAMREARAGRGPCFVETFTYRWNGHVGPEDDDHLGYRPLEERAFWKANCPILLLEEQLLAQGWLTPARKDAMLGEIREELAEAFAFAKRSPFPSVANWHDLNYSSSSPLADRLLIEADSATFNHDQTDALPAPY